MMNKERNISRVLVLIFLCVFAVSCSRPDNSAMETIEIPNRIDPDIYLTEIASSVNTIQLETLEDALISNIYDVKLFGDKMYVKDRNRQILVFDKAGNFIKNLLPLGDGPGEAKVVTSFESDEESGEIYASSFRKILVYSEEEGFLQEKSFPINLSYLTVLGGKLYTVSEFNMKPIETGFSNETVLFELGTQLELGDSLLLRQVVLDQKMILGFPTRNFVSRVGNQNFVYTPTPPIDKVFRDTLYQIKDNRLFPFIKLNFDPPHFDSNGNKAIMILNIYLAKDYLLSEYEQDSKKRFILYDRKNKKRYNLNDGFLDEQGDKIVLRPLDLSNNVFYYFKSMEFSDSSKEELNPVIGIVKLK